MAAGRCYVECVRWIRSKTEEAVHAFLHFVIRNK